MNINTIDLTPDEARAILADGRLILASREEIEYGIAAAAERNTLRAEVERLRGELGAAKAEWSEVVRDQMEGDAAIRDSINRNTDGNLHGGIYATIAKALDTATARAEAAEAHVIRLPLELAAAKGGVEHDGNKYLLTRWDLLELLKKAEARAETAEAQVAELRAALESITTSEPIDNDPIHKRIKYVEFQVYRDELEEWKGLVARTPAQSLAAVQARALREAAERISTMPERMGNAFGGITRGDVRREVLMMAERLEKEATDAPR